MLHPRFIRLALHVKVGAEIKKLAGDEREEGAVIEVRCLIDEFVVPDDLVFEHNACGIEHNYVNVAKTGLGQRGEEIELGKGRFISPEHERQIEIAFGMHAPRGRRPKEVDGLDSGEACEYASQMVKLRMERCGHSDRRRWF